MGFSVIETGRIGGDHGSEPEAHLPMKPLGRAEAIFRWIAFIPCGLIAGLVAYYTVVLIGSGAWNRLFQTRPPMPPEPALYRLFFQLLAACFAGFMGVSLGALVAPASRGIAGAILVGLIAAICVELAVQSIRLGTLGNLGPLFLGGVSALWSGRSAMRSLAHVFGWRGAPGFPATQYWRTK